MGRLTGSGARVGWDTVDEACGRHADRVLFGHLFDSPTAEQELSGTAPLRRHSPFDPTEVRSM
jgi:hypothetical protein